MFAIAKGSQTCLQVKEISWTWLWEVLKVLARFQLISLRSFGYKQYYCSKSLILASLFTSLVIKLIKCWPDSLHIELRDFSCDIINN